MKRLINCLIIMMFIFVVGLPAVVLAEDTILPAGQGSATDCKQPCLDNDKACKKYCGDYKANDFLQFGVDLTIIILGVVGALAFAAFVAGGIMFLASGGNTKWIEQGKATILGAVIGLVVVFASYTIVSFVTKNVLGIDSEEKIFTTDWF